MPPIKIGMVSLGCPKNLVDSEVMLGTLARDQYLITPRADEADVLIVNTCGFIDKAKQESVDTILEMARYKASGSCKRLVVTGCLVQGYVDELKKDLPEVDAFLGSADYGAISEIVGELLAKDGRKAMVAVGNPVALYDEHAPRLLSTPPWTAYLKMAEGCDHACAFCDIPRLRGKMRSRTIESVAAEARQLVERGVKEINLISQDSSEYGRDIYGKPRLAELMEAVAAVEGLAWARVHYLYPAFLDDKLMDVMASKANLVKYVDLPLQHADDAMLRSMRRPGSYENNLNLLRRFRERVPGVTLRSSFIVGFPGETDEQFETLLRFLNEAQLDRAGFFTYSQEAATASGSMPGQLPEKIKRERQRQALNLAAEISTQRLKQKVGEIIEVLLEREPGGAELKGLDSVEHGVARSRDEKAPARSIFPLSADSAYSGRSRGDAPDIDGRVIFTAPKDAGLKPGDLVRVKIESSDAYDLRGVLA